MNLEPVNACRFCYLFIAGIRNKVAYNTGTTIMVRTDPNASPNMMATDKDTQNTSCDKGAMPARKGRRKRMAFANNPRKTR